MVEVWSKVKTKVKSVSQVWCHVSRERTTDAECFGFSTSVTLNSFLQLENCSPLSAVGCHESWEVRERLRWAVRFFVLWLVSATP